MALTEPAFPPGGYPLGPETASLAIRTFRAGAAARMGHDLTLTFESWTGSAVVADGVATVTASFAVGSLALVSAVGGVPLGGAEPSLVLGNARKLLRAAKHPEASFEGTGRPEAPGTGRIEGSLTVAGATRPVTVRVERDGDGARATATVVQTAFGITPYRAFLGALQVRDEVEVTVLLRAVPPLPLS